MNGLDEYVQISKYSLNRDGRREVRGEVIDRVIEMHQERFGALLGGVPEWPRVEEALRAGRILGSQRAQQFGGRPMLAKNARGYNCSMTHANRPRVLQEAFWLLLCGCGVGFSVQRHHTARIPVLRPVRGTPKVYTIPDTIEGWADALGVLASSYLDDDHPFPEWAGVPVVFDGSKIRPKGAPISSGSKAPGPGPLLAALESARRVFARTATTSTRRMEPIDVYDVLMYAAQSVLSGGVRRSATIALFSADDEQMIGAKHAPGWFDEHPQRQYSNNSAMLLRDGTSFETFARIVDYAKNYGEPAPLWVDDLELTVNPCAEISAWPVLEVDGDDESPVVLPGSVSGVSYDPIRHVKQFSGVQFCNLTTVNGGAVRTVEDFIEAATLAAVLGTLQAAYTRFEYLGEVSERITEQEALLGVSMTGMSDCPDVLFDPAVLRAGALAVREANERTAATIGINPAARLTALKPEGTGTLTLGTLAAGVHPWPARRGIRHVRANVQEPPFQHYGAINPHAIRELAPTDPARETTKVLAFAFEAPEGATTKAEITGLELLERVRLVQENWVIPGTVLERCTRPWLRDNVSNTIHIRDDVEWNAAVSYIYEHRDAFAGVTLMMEHAEKSYWNAPNVTVLLPSEQDHRYGETAVELAEEILQRAPGMTGQDAWGRVHNAIAGHPVVWDDPIAEVAWEALVDVLGDARRASECVKDVIAWAQWNALRDLHTPVDWLDMVETEDGVDFGAEAACAGGACLVDFGTPAPALDTFPTVLGALPSK